MEKEQFTQLKTYLSIIWLTLIVILIILMTMLSSCTKPEYCYHCTSPIMQDVYYRVSSPAEMQERIDWRIEHLNDTLTCKVID